jgi:glutathione S-transferase
MSPPRITYFDIRGRIEPVRLIFEELGIEYEDRRIASIEEWQALKPTLPFGQMPIYEDGRRTIVQSHAILRHVARVHELYGRDEEEHVQCDIAEEAIAEIRESVWRYQWQPDQAHRAAQFRDETLAPALDALQRWFLRAGHQPYWVGGSLTYVDFLAFAFLDELRAFFAETLERFPHLRVCRDAVATRPRIAAYVVSERRPAAFGYALNGLKYDPEVRRSVRD